MRRLTARQSLVFWLVVGGLYWLDAHHPVTTVPVQSAWVALVVGWVISAFTAIGEAAVTVAITIAQAAVMIGTAIAHFALAVAHVFVKVYGFVGKFWTGVLRPFVTKVWEHLARFERWLKDTVGPVLKFLDRVRLEFRKFYERWFRPIFDTIDAVRGTLRVLGLLHFEWARQVDAKLGELENRIMAPLRAVMVRLNEVSDWLNRIVTLDGLLQRKALIESMWRDAALGLNIWWRSVHRPMTAEKRAEYERRADARPLAAVVSDLQAYAEHQGGPDATRINEHVADLRLRLRAM